MNKKSSKLLAAVAVFAIVACAFAIIPVGDADGTTPTVITGDKTTLAAGAYNLTADVAADIAVTAGTVTLDLNGYKLTNKSVGHTITVSGGTLTITDSSVSKTGTVDNVSNGKAALYVTGGTVTLDGGTFDRSKETGKSLTEGGDNTWYTVSNNGSLTVNDGAKITQNGRYSSLVNNDSSGTLTINGGVLTGGSNTVKNNGTLTVNGGTLTNTTQNVVANYGTATLDGGTFESSDRVIFTSAYNGNTAGNLTITGGTYTAGEGKPVIRNGIMAAGQMNMGTIMITDTNSPVFNSDLMTIIPNTADPTSTVTLDLTVDGKNVTLATTMPGTTGLKVSKTGEISGTIVSGTISTDVADQSLTLRNLTIEGAVTLSDPATVTGSLNVKDTGSTSKSAITVSENSIVNLAGTIANEVINNGTIAITTASAAITGTLSGTGTIDSSAIQENAVLGGTIDTNTAFGKTQEVTLAADTTLVNKTILTISGTLVIPEGITLTLKDRSVLLITGSQAKIINDGTIVVESIGQVDASINAAIPAVDSELSGNVALKAVVINGAAAENNGTINLAFEGPLDDTVTADNLDGTDAIAKYGGTYNFYVVNGTIFKNNGQITIEEYNTLAINNNSDGTILMNNKDATVDSDGGIIGLIDTAGLVSVNGFFIGNISIVSEDAVVVIEKWFTDSTINFSVDNEGLVLGDKSKVDAASADKATFSITYHEGLTGDDTGYVSLEGLTFTAKALYDKEAIVQYDSALVVSGTLDYATLATTTISTPQGSVTLANNIIMSDALTVSDYTGIVVGGTMTVSGEMVVEKSASFTTSGDGKAIVTGKATSVANKLSSANIEAAYYVVKKDATNPNSDDQHIYTNLDAALLAAPEKITVTGVAIIKTEVNIPNGVEVDAKNGMNIEKTGILTVIDGGKLKVTGTTDVNGALLFENKKSKITGIVSDVTSEDDVSILYSGLTFALANASEGDTIKVSNGTDSVEIEDDVSIDTGVVLDTNTANLVVKAGGSLTINGTLFLNNATTLSTLGADEENNKAAGKVVFNGIVKSTADMSSMTVGGKLIAGAYYSMIEGGAPVYYIESVANAAPKAATVADGIIDLRGELKIGDVSFTGTSDVAVTVNVYGELSAGTITLDLATINFNGKEFKGTVTDGAGSFVLDVVAYTGSAISSAVVDEVEVFYAKGQFVTDLDNTKDGYEGQFVVKNAASMDAADIDNVVVDGTLSIINTTTVIDNMVINGTVNVANKATLDAGVVEVYGTLVAAEKTDEAAKGTAVIDKLFVGLSKKVTLGANAAVTGDVTGTDYTIVAAGATVPETISKADGVKTTVLYIDGKEYATVYDMTGTLKIGDITPDLEDADFQKWTDADGNDLSDKLIGAVERAEAEVDYEIYMLSFTSSEGIADVYVDGNLVNGVTFVAAGEHEIEYTLKGGYVGPAILTIDGKKVDGMKFTVGGDDYDYNVQLSGITAKDTSASSSSGMSLTEILLIVLVVLIAIMAIVIAMRMMRS